MSSAGKTVQRGYNYRHKQLRARLAPYVAAGKAICWRCGEHIKAGAPWDLGHDDADRRIYRGPEHRGRECKAGGNRATAGRRPGAKPRRTNAAPDPLVDTSRDW